MTSRTSFVAACALTLALAPLPPAQELSFGNPAPLPGDAALGAPAGHQVEADVARGGAQLLSVWSDYRTSPDDYPPFLSEGSGGDIYGARLDAAGNPIDVGPIVIDEGLGDQTEPRVAWNGQNWLVVWREATPTLPTYERLRAARVAPDGTVLDVVPITVHDDESTYTEFAVAGGGGEWVALFQASGPSSGILAVRIADDGTVVNPGGLLIHATSFLTDFDLAFSQDQVLVVWSGPFDPPSARRFTPALAPIDATPFALPFADRVASDGTDFLVVWASGPPPSATVEAVLVTHAGSLPNPSGVTLFTAGGQAGTCCADVAWDGTTYWTSWGGTWLARVTSAGTVVDPGGFPAPPSPSLLSVPLELDAAPGGGLQYVWNDGASGADYPKDVYSTRVSAAGELAAPVLVSTGAPAQVESDFAAGDGTHLVVFRSRLSTSARILAHRVDDGGNALDPEPIEVASGPTPGLGVPTIGAPAAAWNGALFMITWSDGVSTYARRMLADGTFVDATPLTVMPGFDPDVAAVGQDFLVVAIDLLFGNPQWQATHSMRVSGATGENLDPEPNALGGFVIFAQHPHVVSFGGRWLATWQTNISHNNPAASTRGAFVDTDGTTPGVFDVGIGWRPDVAVSNDRALFVAVTNTIASSTTDLEGQVMASDGTFIGAPFLISAAADKQLDPAVTWNGSHFVVAWEDKRNSAIYFDERTDVYGARVAADGTVLDPAGVLLAGSARPEIDPALVTLGSTTLLAVSGFDARPAFAAYRLDVRASAPGPRPRGPRRSHHGDVPGPGGSRSAR